MDELNKVSDREVILPNNIVDEYIKTSNKYNNLPKLNGEEREVVKYFMLKHKTNISGKGITQGYSLAVVSLEKLKKAENKDVQKLLLEYLILRVALVEEFIRFKNKELQDKYKKARDIISRGRKYKPNKIMESYDIELLTSLLIDNKYS
ncbi:hypothetical protein H5972_09040, partial [Ligilactobacillus salivarius]|nr:hypothetical protein [Ligilactobacillus salivarius]